MSLAVQIEARAARYLARRQEAGWSASHQAELDAWLEESTAHEVAYLRLEYGWRKVDRLAALRGFPVPAMQPGKRSEHPAAKFSAAVRDRRRPLMVGVSFAMALAILFVSLQSGWFTRHNYATEIGGHETVPLADGSRIELNTDTQLQTEVGEKTRRVWLERGEAYFEVAPDAARPFIVYAGTRRVTVLGTKFLVRRDAQRVKVAVAEGRVQMEDLEPKMPAPPVFMTRGDTVVAEGPAKLVTSKSVDMVSNELSWRHGVLTFDQTSLAEAADEFNRYNRKKLLIAAAAAGVRIGGSFEAANVDAFVRLLQHGFGLKAVEDGGEIRVSE